MNVSDNDALGDASGCQRAQKRPQKGVNTYPLIYKLGLWFAFIPLSVVAVGRAIGVIDARDRDAQAQQDESCSVPC